MITPRREVERCVSQTQSVSRSHRLGILASGFAILALAVAAGIWLSFKQWDRGSPYDHLLNWRGVNPVGRATIGPLLFAVYVFPVTIPVLLVLLVPIYFGMTRKRLWPLAILGFLSVAILWLLFVTALWTID
jgi:hypothetical protein